MNPNKRRSLVGARYFAMFVTVSLAAVGCSDDSEQVPAVGGEEAPNITVEFKNYCQDTVTVYRTPASGAMCTMVEDTETLTEGTLPNAYSSSTSGMANCTTASRVEFTYGADGDVSYDLSTNGGCPTTGCEQQTVPFYNVSMRILALQATAPTECALPQWKGPGNTTAEDLRGVSSQICDEATCPTAYQTPTSGPQFIARNTGVTKYIVEWCPERNQNQVPVCDPPTFSEAAPCAFVCWANAVKAAELCENTAPGNELCTVAPFTPNPAVDPLAAYCVRSSDCTSNGGEPCGCCLEDSDCTSPQRCENFLCQ